MTETTATQPQTPAEVLDALMEANRVRPEGDPFAFYLMLQIRDAEYELTRATDELRSAAERTRDRAEHVLRDPDAGTAHNVNRLGVLQSTDLDRLAGERYLADKNLGNALRVATSYLAR